MARDALALFPDSPMKQALDEAVEFCTGRTHLAGRGSLALLLQSGRLDQRPPLFHVRLWKARSSSFVEPTAIMAWSSRRFLIAGSLVAAAAAADSLAMISFGVLPGTNRAYQPLTSP